MSDYVPITTRRALVVVLSRVKMNGNAGRELMHQLQNEIRGDTHSKYDPLDVEACRIAMMQLLDDLDGIDMSYSKSAMVSRVGDARKTIRRFLT